MDKIEIRKLEIFAHHGVYEEEQRLGQKFVLSLILETNTRAAGKKDELELTMNYGALAKEVTKLVQQENHKLLECVAETVAESLLKSHKDLLERITVKVEKPWAPVGLPLETAAVEITRGWHVAYLSLGSNLGDRRGYLEQAKEKLSVHEEIEVIESSSLIETEPYGYTDQPAFLNACLKLRTLLSPEELLDVTQTIEKEAHRERKIHWGPRTLDLDILFYDNEIIGTKRLIIPHPEIEKRAFVLEPMNEIAPWFRHPVSHKTIRQLLEERIAAD